MLEWIVVLSLLKLKDKNNEHVHLKCKYVVIVVWNVLQEFKFHFYQGYCKQWSKVCKNMGFNKVILDIGTCNYYGLPWNITSIDKLFLHPFHHFFHCLVMILN
jgi:hypothetical protein